MRLVIHQPYFIPWMGYFSKLSYSDIFVCLDNAQFRKRHLFDRTKIINMHGQITWLSLPVGEKLGILCNQVTTQNIIRHSDPDYAENILLTIKYSYSKAYFFNDEWNDVYQALYEPLKQKELVKINLGIIKNLSALIGIKMPEIILASELVGNEFDDPTERLLQISKILKAESIIIGGGQGTAIHNWDLLQKENIKIFVQDFLSNQPQYYQYRRSKSGFARAMAIIDAILNVGRKSTLQMLTNTACEPTESILHSN